MELFEATKDRRTVRTFTSKKIPKSDLEKMVDAGRLAPSAVKGQRWDFVVVTEDKVIKQMTKHFLAGRKYGTFEDGEFDAVSAIIAVIVDGSHEHWRGNGSAATQNILLAARGLGWGSCWIEGQMRSLEDEFKRLLGVPGGKRILLLIALGEPVRWSLPPPKKSLSEVLDWEKYKER